MAYQTLIFFCLHCGIIDLQNFEYLENQINVVFSRTLFFIIYESLNIEVIFFPRFVAMHTTIPPALLGFVWDYDFNKCDFKITTF
jgi:hypothetical protein